MPDRPRRLVAADAGKTRQANVRPLRRAPGQRDEQGLAEDRAQAARLLESYATGRVKSKQGRTRYMKCWRCQKTFKAIETKPGKAKSTPDDDDPGAGENATGDPADTSGDAAPTKSPEKGPRGGREKTPAKRRKR